ncbi:MAG TPA: TlyA family RNA methyltransferase [Acidimicrobiia bacterium]|nr:TlyA family RNA methyltransferase [Acidimicrobiia bacterium]
MPTRRRLDAELVRRGMVASRTEAQRLITVGGVTVSGRPSARPATLVSAGEPIEMAETDRWASRAGGKLAAALTTFTVTAEGRAALDVGASTGGFTDVLLAHGAASVVAVDVGYGQLVWRLRTDPRVTVHDRTNFRSVDVAALGAPFDLVVVDVSFISVVLLAGNLARAGRRGTEYVVLVKPQFEVGRDGVGPGGIVRNPEAHRDAVAAVAAGLATEGLAPRGVMPSPVRGTKGNLEFLLHAVKGDEPMDLTALLEGIHE